MGAVAMGAMVRRDHRQDWQEGGRGGHNNADGKFVSAHDLRRAFGTRWAKRVMTAVLTRLMRHASIQTTMVYYVDLDAADVADRLWAGWGEREQHPGRWQHSWQHSPRRGQETRRGPRRRIGGSPLHFTRYGRPFLVDRVGVAPTTRGFSVRCSTT